MQDTIPIILSHLSIPDILNSATINKLFRQSYKSNIIWESQLSNTFNTNTLKKSTYYKTFKHLYQSTQLLKIFTNNNLTIDNIHTTTQLNKSQYNINYIPPSITKLKSLHTFSLKHQCNPKFSSQIGKLQTLKQLTLFSCQLRTLPPEIYQLTNLTSLDISTNQIHSLSPTIGNLTNLKTLIIKHNLFDILPSEISNLTNLTELELGNNNLKMPSLKHFTNLQSLHIRAIDFTLSDDICNLTSLTNINLKRIKSFTIPKDFTINKDIKFTF